MSSGENHGNEEMLGAETSSAAKKVINYQKCVIIELFGRVKITLKRNKREGKDLDILVVFREKDKEGI